MYFVLVAGAALPALAAALLRAFGVALVIGAAAVWVLNWIQVRHPQRETTAGLEAASRWLGVRAELGANEVFGRYTPLTVPLWDRLLAYGAASPREQAIRCLSGPSRTRLRGARTVAAGVPFASVIRGSGRRAGASTQRCALRRRGRGRVRRGRLYYHGVGLLDSAGDGWAGIVPAAYIALLCLGVVVGVAVAIMAVQDQWSSYDVTGPILRLRAFGGEEDEKDARYYAAVEDGRSRGILAYRLDEEQYGGLTQGALVTVTVTPRLGHVRWLDAAGEAGLAVPESG